MRYVGFVTPHFPLIVPQKYLDLYPDEEAICRPVQFEPEEWNHHPVVEDYRRYCGTEQVSREQAIHAIRTYYGLCSFMDEQVGVVMEALRDSGLDTCTRVIYSADHGDTMGDHGVYFKSTMYEGSVGIPMMMKGPDIPAGERRDTISHPPAAPRPTRHTPKHPNPPEQTPASPVHTRLSPIA